MRMRPGMIWMLNRRLPQAAPGLQQRPRRDGRWVPALLAALPYGRLRAAVAAAAPRGDML